MGPSSPADERERVEEEDGHQHDAHEEAGDVRGTGGSVHQVGRQDGELGALVEGGVGLQGGILVLKGEGEGRRERGMGKGRGEEGEGHGRRERGMGGGRG